MKIAYIIPKLKDSGLTRIPFWLSKNFYPDNQVKIFYFSDTHSQDKLLHFDAPVQKISFTSFCKELNDYDVIHSHGLKPDVYLALNYDNISAVKITTIHGYHVEDLIYEKNRIFGWIFGNLWDYYCGKLDCLVCLTKTMQTYYQQRLKSTNIKFIFNGINCDLYSNYDKKNNLANIEKEKKIKIVTVSSLNRRKGIDQLIKLLKKINAII
jgi:glycosyltransferase involved in cell wall biosynthesis